MRQKLSNGAVIIIGLMSWYFGITPVTAITPNDPTVDFVARILGETEDRWAEIVIGLIVWLLLRRSPAASRAPPNGWRGWYVEF